VKNLHWTDRLSEYHDGELSPAEHSACESHLAQCDECREVLDDIRSVITDARIEIGHVPANDLWPGIAARLSSARADAVHTMDERLENVVDLRARASVFSRQISVTIPQLALAASLLIAVSSGVAYIAAGRLPSRAVATAPETIQAVAEPMLPTSGNFAPANFADAQFEGAVADLERILSEQRDELDPRTVIVIERNLNAIDEAIRQARAALASDPANTFLNSHLAEARRRKLELLRQATSIAGD
jgi:hypothetical protein